MASSQHDSHWDKSTSEIQSEDSDALFQARPNRWRGPPQSWRALTEDDRLTWCALARLRNQDLSVHLYNAFALNNAPRFPEQHQHAAAAAAGAKPWAPPRGWTAWPLPARLVPPEDFLQRTEDDDEAFTFRKAEREAPGRQLEEVVSAAILRCAKDKFRKRQLEGARGLANDGEAFGTEPELEPEPVSSGSDSASSEVESDEDAGEVVAASAEPRRSRAEAGEWTYKPAIAIDDDASYALIRPSTREILSKLDRTLTILHNARTISARTPADTDSAPSASGTEDALYDEAALGRRRRSRDAAAAAAASTASAPRPKSSRGRKPTAVPREGESERDFLRRRAKELKKKRPVFEDEQGGAATADATRKPGRSRRKRERVDETGEFWRQKRLHRLKLRDWSDVMGAAALAGFDARVIERATQRCANLFGQGMEMHTIDEDAGVSTRRYVPGQVVLLSDSQEEEDRQSRTTSRRSSVAHSRAVALASTDEEDDEDEDEDEDEDDECERERRRLKPFGTRQRRSSSHGSVLGGSYCHYAGCERATRSFDRPSNLRRHLELVHGEVVSPKVSAPQAGRPRPGTLQAKKAFYCSQADCERATRPFEKGHNLRRHLERVHGESIGLRSKAPPDVLNTAAKEPVRGAYLCPLAGCERATRAFDKRSNLARHLKLVHENGASKAHGLKFPEKQQQEEQEDHTEAFA